MEKYLPYAVLFLRFALAVTLLAAVADKLGYWGEPGTPAIVWGNWDTYVTNFRNIVPYIPEGINEKLAILTTILEVILALMLLFGLKVRWAAIGTGLYTLAITILLLLSNDVKTAFNYSLFITCAASFLLACCPVFRFTRHGIKKRSTFNPY